jgi:hypothetical protein
MGLAAVKNNVRLWRAVVLANYRGQHLSAHAFRALAGETDEDHLAAAAWNFLCLIETRDRIAKGLLPGELETLPQA